jgi:hypothetical protein
LRKRGQKGFDRFYSNHQRAEALDKRLQGWFFIALVDIEQRTVCLNGILTPIPWMD